MPVLLTTITIACPEKESSVHYLVSLESLHDVSEDMG